MIKTARPTKSSKAGLINSLILFWPLSASALDSLVESVNPVSGRVQSGWDSRYLSEGRDALGGDSLWASSVDVFWNTLAGRVWYATSPQQSYDELQLQLALGHRVGAFDLYIAYTHLDFPEDNANDNEVSAGFMWSGLPRNVEFSTDAVYSFDAQGLYLEFTLGRRFELNEALAVDVSSVLGVNKGYVSDGHDGATSFTFGVGSEYMMTPSVALTTYITRSWGINRNRNLAGDELLIDFTHGGIGISWRFGSGY